MQAKIEELQHIGTKAAAELMDISESTFRQWLCEGRFPYVKVGRRTVISVRDLATFLEKGRVQKKSA